MRSKTLLTEADKELKVFGIYESNGRKAIIKTDPNGYYIYKYADDGLVPILEIELCMNVAISRVEKWIKC